MSLPSIVTFYKEDEEVSRQFINCGWICSESSVKSGIRRSIAAANISNCYFDWDTASAYGLTFKKEDIENER